MTWMKNVIFPVNIYFLLIILEGTKYYALHLLYDQKPKCFKALKKYKKQCNKLILLYVTFSNNRLKCQI